MVYHTYVFDEIFVEPEFGQEVAKKLGTGLFSTLHGPNYQKKSIPAYAPNLQKRAC